MKNFCDYTIDVPWAVYYQKLCKINKAKLPIFESHGNICYFEILRESQEIWKSRRTLSNMSKENRKYVGGTYFKKEAAWLGDMSPNGYYKNAINENHGKLSEALDLIHMEGCVDKNLFNKFCNFYKKSFTNAALGGASRLLTTKRPDLFLSKTSLNKKYISNLFGISEFHLDNFDKYYQLHNEEIWKCVWFNSPKPNTNNKNEIDSWNFRVALLDCILIQNYDKKQSQDLI